MKKQKRTGNRKTAYALMGAMLLAMPSATTAFGASTQPPLASVQQANHEYLVPKGSDFNQPWDDASPEVKKQLFPVTRRDWEWNPIHLVFPIPSSELAANKLLEQNPGY